MANGHFVWYKPNHEDRPSYNGTVPRLSSSIDLKLRFLNPDDLDEVKILCQDWFPVEYPESWYRDITSNPRFYSLAAVLEHRIIGLVVAEIKDQTYLNKEDRDILAISQQRGCKIAYILSLGVSRQHRRNGVASLLLDNLLMHLTTEENKCVKAVLLHVLTSNASAIRFYENRYFRMHSFLPYYYSIEGAFRDGFSYVLYINGGHPPWGLLDYVKYGCTLLRDATIWCTWPVKVLSMVRVAYRRLIPAVTRLAQSTVAMGS